MDVGQKDHVEHGIARCRGPSIDCLLDISNVTSDDNEVVTRLNRARMEGADGRPLDHGVTGDDACGHRVEFEECQRRMGGHG